MKDMTVELDGVYTATLHLTVPKSQIRGIEDLKEPLHLTLGQKKKKRSLAANAYLWVLCSKLGNKLKLPKEEVYRKAVREAGYFDIVAGVSNGALEALETAWRSKGIGWQTERLEGTINGLNQLILYYGSSTYTTDQMARLLDIVIADAEEQGIETLTPNEKSLMLEEWKNG